MAAFSGPGPDGVLRVWDQHMGGIGIRNDECKHGWSERVARLFSERREGKGKKARSEPFQSLLRLEGPAERQQAKTIQSQSQTEQHRKRRCEFLSAFLLSCRTFRFEIE